MKKIFEHLLSKKIVMISDYVDPDEYLPEEWKNEQLFIETLKKEINDAGVLFFYQEVKNLKELKSYLSQFNKKDVVIFNWCECLDQREGTAYLVARYLEKENFIFTGSGSKTLKLTDNKKKVKKILLNNGILTPKYTVLKTLEDPIQSQKLKLDFPLILKLNDRHASAGISLENIVYDIDSLAKVAKRLFGEYKTEILVEEFIDGSEYTVTVWGNYSKSECIDINKEDFKDPNISKIFTEKAKFDYSSPESKNTISSQVTNTFDEEFLKNNSLHAYSILGFNDYGVFEYRQNDKGIYLIDCNPNQFLGLDGILFEATKKFGLNHGETILQICEFAVKRYMLKN